MKAFASIVLAPRWVSQSLGSTVRRAATRGTLPLVFLVALALASSGGSSAAMAASSVAAAHQQIVQIVPQMQCGAILLPC